MRVASATDDGRRPRVAHARRVRGSPERRRHRRRAPRGAPAPRPAWPRSPSAPSASSSATSGRARSTRCRRSSPPTTTPCGPPRPSVYGVISLVFWTITIIVSIKYVTFIMRADNEGEGGIMALIALIQRGVRLQRRSAKAALVALGIFGASLFYGDGMITPAISVLSAVEGLEVAAPSMESLVVPITLVILTVLFAVQRYGTGAVGRAFGPVMGTWFALLAVSGLGKVVAHPGILRAISPSYGLSFLFEHGHVAFIALGSVVLTVTGAEALYADMGHFGRPPIRRAWFAIVFPALILNYMGQGALILDTPRAIDNPFFLLFPHWARIPMVLAATAATVIASQAVISGAFSVTRQAVQLGFLPRLTIRHTSHQEVGQVYVPAVNWGIFVAVVALVVGFGSSAALASAYGIAVTGTLAIDTLLFFVVVRHLWHKPLWLSVAGATALPRRGPDLLLGQPDQGPARRLVPALDRARDLRRADHVAARPRDRDAQPDRGGGPAARVHRGDPGHGASRLPRAEHRHLPQRQHRDHAAGAAGQRRAQPHRPRVRRDHVDRDAEGPARPARRARHRRRPRLPRRRDHAHDGAHRVHGQDRRPGHGAHGGRGGGGRARPRARVVLPLAHHDRARPTRRGWRAGARGSSSSSRATPPTPSRSSASPTTRPWS